MYREFYGLAGCPFQMTPDPQFIFESQSHRHALSYLSRAMAQGEGFIIVTGEDGAGKSTLVSQLVAAIDPVGLTTAQLCGEFAGEDIIPVIARAFGLAANPCNMGDIGAIEYFLQDEARAGRRCLLVVDEAQLLPIAMLEQLRVLADLQLGAHPLLQILLIGQPKFSSRLKRHPALKELRLRVLASHHLAPLEPQEVEGYVRHRLECVGWNGRPSFDPGVYASVHRASGGLPRRINQIVDRILLLGAAALKERIENDLVLQVLAESGEAGLQSADPVRATYPRSIQPWPDAETKQWTVEPIAGAISAVPTQKTQAEAPDRSGAEIRELHEAALELAITAAHIGAQTGHVGQNRVNLPGVELSQSDLAFLLERLATLEHRAIAHDRTIHHTLAMVIDWIERDASRDLAA
ncbi:MAG: AAA family ATPase [Pseudomonadota bacterium]|nr:AAA family ATPase [Pseudomonadota bacterium]